MRKKISIFVVFLFVTVCALVAQGPPPVEDPPPPGNDPGTKVDGTPLDGGLISVLLSGGIAYYISKRRKAKKAEETGE